MHVPKQRVLLFANSNRKAHCPPILDAVFKTHGLEALFSQHLDRLDRQDTIRSSAIGDNFLILGMIGGIFKLYSRHILRHKFTDILCLNFFFFFQFFHAVFKHG